MLKTIVSIALVVLLASQITPATPRASSPDTEFDREEPFVKRPAQWVVDGRWIGFGVAYGPHRDGQRPGGESPTTRQLREDLHIISRHWRLVRVYNSVGPAETILQIIREDNLDVRVMLGVWIAVSERRDDDGKTIERFPDAIAANRSEVEAGIRLANEYPETVIAVCVGNETQVFWSAHRSPMDLWIGYVRGVRAGTTAPVTVADDFNFWNKPESHGVADEVDFITMHAHPLWNGLTIENALDWTRETVQSIMEEHPGHTVVLGETGWATQKHTEGEQAVLMKGVAGESQQKAFYAAVSDWAIQEHIPTFFFEAFDENWKGGAHPDEVEKHWGLYRADRSPKAVFANN